MEETIKNVKDYIEVLNFIKMKLLSTHEYSEDEYVYMNYNYNMRLFTYELNKTGVYKGSSKVPMYKFFPEFSHINNVFLATDKSDKDLIVKIVNEYFQAFSKYNDDHIRGAVRFASLVSSLCEKINKNVYPFYRDKNLLITDVGWFNEPNLVVFEMSNHSDEEDQSFSINDLVIKYNHKISEDDVRTILNAYISAFEDVDVLKYLAE